MALGILAASRQIPANRLHHYEFAGELSLSGELRPIRGALAMSYAMLRGGNERAFIVPQANANEAALADGAIIHPARSLLQVCAHFSSSDATGTLSRHLAQIPEVRRDYPDFADVKGQGVPKRVLEIAAAGGHSVLLVGPPGAGKTMLANRFPGLLPTMTDAEALEAATVQSITGQFRAEQWKQRPFRAPHHTSSGIALVGGGSVPRPGEISLAHCGVLFLDEFMFRCSFSCLSSAA